MKATRKQIMDGLEVYAQHMDQILATLESHNGIMTTNQFRREFAKKDFADHDVRANTIILYNYQDRVRRRIDLVKWESLMRYMIDVGLMEEEDNDEDDDTLLS